MMLESASYIHMQGAAYYSADNVASGYLFLDPR